MKCSDIPDRDVLAWLERFDREHDGLNALRFEPAVSGDRSIHHAMPPGTPPKVMLAKMAKLIRRGLVGGCACGCRGDFWISAQGKAFLAKEAA